MKINKKMTNKDIPKDYTKDKFLEDLKKVCRPVKKSDKQQPSSCKT
ncbi:hypothetical protein ES703_05856 [subsurface metagenome]